MHPDSDVFSGDRGQKVISCNLGSFRIYQHTIKMIGVPRVFRWFLRKDQRQVADFLLIDRPYFLTPLPVFADPTQLMDTEGGLDTHHVVLVATLDNLVVLVTFVAEATLRVFAHSVQRKHLNPIRVSFVRRQNHSSLTRREVFRHLRTKTPEGTERSSMLSFVHRLDRVSTMQHLSAK